MAAKAQGRIPLEPNLVPSGPGRDLFLWLIEQLGSDNWRGADRKYQLAELREQALTRAGWCGDEQLKLRVIVSTLCDLYSKGWRFLSDPQGIYTLQPSKIHDEPLAEKERVRASLIIERESQLSVPNTRAFIKSMERRRLATAGWCSIFSLMRDGRDLAAKLREAAAEPAGDARLAKLRLAIDPYLQFADAGKDKFTDLDLGDVWRYFRHTWANPYLSMPGRKFWVLVRDRSAPNHPVIGIASFGNSVVHQGPRDELIGWTSAKLLARLDAEANKKWADWLIESLDLQFKGVHIQDFLEDGLITAQEVKRPTGAVVERLRGFALSQKKVHDGDDRVSEYDRDASIHKVDWLLRAKTNLFRWKRAELLANLLEVRWHWQALGFDSPGADKLRSLLASKLGKRSIELLLRRIKSDHVGIDMLEITTCGAVAPYNSILGGKLVAMLLSSPEIIYTYNQKYGASPSVIASSIAGRPVLRKPNLVYLGTTSLYGIGSSQYNRISIPAEEVGGKTSEVLRYLKLGDTEGFGCTHFSSATSKEVDELLEAIEMNGKVNSIFGEGISPRMRKLRIGLSAAGLPSEKLLKHGSHRIVYGVPLASNFREVLLGLKDRPNYIVPAKGDHEKSTRLISDYWMRRWLSGRIENPAVLSEVEQDTLIFPIEHRGRVVLPTEDEEPSLFSGSWS